MQFKPEKIPSTYPDGAMPKVSLDSRFSNYLEKVSKLVTRNAISILIPLVEADMNIESEPVDTLILVDVIAGKEGSRLGPGERTTLLKSSRINDGENVSPGESAMPYDSIIVGKDKECNVYQFYFLSFT